jgi:hypothetical protein
LPGMSPPVAEFRRVEQQDWREMKWAHIIYFIVPCDLFEMFFVHTLMSRY